MEQSNREQHVLAREYAPLFKNYSHVLLPGYDRQLRGVSSCAGAEMPRRWPKNDELQNVAEKRRTTKDK